MTVAAGLVMVAAGAMCFGSAVVARRWTGVTAAAVMLLAMLDISFFELVAPLVWGTLLLLAGIALGVELRLAQRVRICGTPHSPGAPQEPVSQHVVMLTAALAYPATAWLVIAHGRGRSGGVGFTATVDLGSHRGHGAGGVLAGSVPAFGVALLAAILLVLAIVTLRRRRRFLAIESGGMAAMLTAMLVGH